MFSSHCMSFRLESIGRKSALRLLSAQSSSFFGYRIRFTCSSFSSSEAFADRYLVNGCVSRLRMKEILNPLSVLSPMVCRSSSCDTNDDTGACDRG